MKDLGKQILMGILEAVMGVLIQMLIELLMQLLTKMSVRMRKQKCEQLQPKHKEMRYGIQQEK